MKRMCAGLGLACTVAWTLSAAAANDGAVERIVHLDEMDHLANRTALFNKGVGVEEARYGVLMLHFATTNRVDCH